MPHLKPITETVLIYQGDDAATLADLRRALSVAEERGAQAIDAAVRDAQTQNLRVGDLDPVVEARKKAEADIEAAQAAFDAFLPEAAERALEVEIRAIGSRRFRELVAEHPPRKVTRKIGDVDTEVLHEDDAQFGVNTETFPRALLTYVDSEDTTIRTITKPEFSGSREIGDFVDDELSEGNMDRLWIAAFARNRASGADPKAELTSLASRSSSET